MTANAVTACSRFSADTGAVLGSRTTTGGVRRFTPDIPALYCTHRRSPDGFIRGCGRFARTQSTRSSAAATRASLRPALADVEGPIEQAWAVSDVLGADAEAAARFLYCDPRAAADPQHASAAELPTPDPEIARALLGAERIGLADELAALDMPTLIMIGLWDRHVGVDLARSLADRLPRSTLRLFAASAHLPDEEEPDAYVAAIREFLHQSSSPAHSPSF